MVTYLNTLALRAEPEIPGDQLHPIMADESQGHLYDPFEAAIDSIENVQPAPRQSIAKRAEEIDNAERSPVSPASGLMSPAEERRPVPSGHTYMEQHFFREIHSRDTVAIVHPIPQQQQNTGIPRDAGTSDETVFATKALFPASKKEPGEPKKEIFWMKASRLETATGPSQKGHEDPVSFLVPAKQSAPASAALPLAKDSSRSLTIGSITIEILPAQTPAVIHTVENRIVQSERVVENFISSRQLFGLSQY